MAKPPRSMAVKPPKAPDSLPMGVRAPATITVPDITTSEPCGCSGGAPHDPRCAATTSPHDTATKAGPALGVATPPQGAKPLGVGRSDRGILRPCHPTPCSRSSLPSSRAPAATSWPPSRCPRPIGPHSSAGTRSTCSKALPPRTRTRASRCTSTRWRCPSWLLTRLTSPSWPVRSTSTRCGPRSSSPCPTFGFLDRLGKESALGGAARARLPRRGLRRGRRGPAGRLGRAQLASGRQGHRPLQLRRRPGPHRPRRLDAGRQPAHLGVRVQLRRPGRHRRWSRPTSSCPSRAISPGRRRPSTRCATRPRTACWCRRTGRRCDRATGCSSGARPAASAPSPSSTC